MTDQREPCGNDDEPRTFTASEMRRMFIDHLKFMAHYWANTKLTAPEFQKELVEKGETLYRLEGLLFSFLVTLDDGSGLPAFDLIPSAHPDDEKFHQENGENWWPREVINECQLHEILSGWGE